MPLFFLDHSPVDTVVLSGDDALHIGRSLRMTVGDPLTLCGPGGIEYQCVISAMGRDTVTAAIFSQAPSQAEPAVGLHLYQALPKGDKMELIVQKAVELGAAEITPVMTRRCISRPDGRAMEKKLQRYQKIAEEAAKQSGRGKIPQVRPLLGFDAAVEQLAALPLSILFYEGGGDSLRELLAVPPSQIGLMVGAEGGFDPEEVCKAVEAGVRAATLGPRILRCETAPLCALSAILYATGGL
ncbi:MAG: 16S rRNA (uracil(1498)-N(3))-methyltransferase [Oscillospiraceae bacterium]|nr:16S rRNA (uracil(1498)-N(3))-methyltransferase [Oscillospiraceae bacterium]